MSQQNFWESLTKSVSQATQAVTDTAANVGKTVGNATAQASEVVSKTIANTGSTAHNAIKNWVCFSENDYLAFYGVLFAVAAADGSIDAEELNLIFSSPDISNMSKSVQEKIQSYSVSPPDLEESLKKLSKADEKLRFGLMFYIFNIIWVDKVLDPGEEKAIELAQKELKITTEQVEAIDAFVQNMGEIRDRGLNDDYAINSINDATARLKKVGVPIESWSTSEAGNNHNQSALSITYSDEVFRERLGGLALQAGKTVVENALTLFYVAQDPKVPAKDKLIIAGALAYLILPIDAVPDFLPAVGFGDDLAALTAALATIALTANINEAKKSAQEKTKELFGDRN